MNKSFKYRIYPTSQQIDRLEQWMVTCGILWNIANEQRKSGYLRSNGEKVYPSCYTQQKEYTELRKCDKYFKDIPRHVGSNVLWSLDHVWQMCFAKMVKSPKWKSKKNPVKSLTESDPRYFKIMENTVQFTKLGCLSAVITRPLEGKPKTCTILKDVDRWYAVIVTELPDQPVFRTEPVVGIDRGIINLAATSDGVLIKGKRFYQEEEKHLATLQRKASSKVKGSNKRKKALRKVAKLHQKIRNRRNHFLHEESTKLSQQYGKIVVEDLKVNNMVKNPNLSKQINDSSWSKFSNMLEYKQAWSGGQYQEVPAPYTSQTCSACGHVDAASRNGEKFVCTKCNHTEHADVNAAKNIKSRGSPSVLPAEGSCADTPLRSGKVKLRSPRRSNKETMKVVSD